MSDERKSVRGRPRTDARERILDAAAMLLAKRGAEVSTEEIADAAGVARRTVFNYFPAREDLLRACLDPILEDGIAIAEDLLARGGRGSAALGELCGELLRRQGDRIGLLGAVDFAGSAGVEALHRRYIERFRELAGEEVDASTLYAVYRCFAPLSSVVAGEADGPERFGAAMRGLVEGMLKGRRRR
ncbi:MAG: helix-turn-helix transcriptional regulator [Spirochaetaceae bacterium]|nr:helix-turn-helix transcriptional regulator [Spirochaetaceae bacterium]